MQRFREILVVASGDESEMRPLIVRAAQLAERNRARLTIFDVVPAANPKRRWVEHAGVSIDLEEAAVEARRQELDSLAATVMTAEVRTAVATGVRFVSVIEKVLRDGHDLVITTPDRPQPRRGLAGATETLHLLRKCPCPVWVDDSTTWSRRDVLVAVGPLDGPDDDADLNRTLLQLGASLARIQGGALHTLHAWRLEGEHLLRHGKVKLPATTVDSMVDDERRFATQALAEVLDDIDLRGVHHHIHLREGRPSEAITALADELEPSVVVMGTLARTGLRGLFIGNTAERVLGELQSSVLAVKPAGFQTPVTLETASPAGRYT